MGFRSTAMVMLMLCVCVNWAFTTDAAEADSVATASATVPCAFEVESIGPFTSGVHGMAFASDGTLYYSDTYRNEGHTARVYSLGPPYDGRSRPTGIAGATVSGLLWLDGALYVCMTGEDRIRRYDSNLKPEREWTVPVPWSVEPVGDALFAVTYDGRVFKLGDDGGIELVLDGLEYPFDLADAGDGTFFATEQVDAGVAGRVRRFDSAGKEVGNLDYAFNNPEGLAIDDHGHLYIADTEAGRLLRAYPDGQVELITDAYEIPIVVVRGPDGNIYFNTAGADPRLVRVRLY